MEIDQHFCKYEAMSRSGAIMNPQHPMTGHDSSVDLGSAPPQDEATKLSQAIGVIDNIDGKNRKLI